MAYRTYDRAWNHTGYAADQQYPGQRDIPPCPQCGEPAERAMGPFDYRECINGHVSEAA